MIETLLPPSAASAEAFDDPPEAELLPEEADRIARAVPKRRAEYRTARWCARRALARIGVAPAPILAGERGAPRWPAGVVGTITHCDGYRAAAVARSADLASLGIDAEPDDRLPDGVLRTVASATEVEHLDRLAATAPGIHWDRLLFCAKEAVYKAWFPLTTRWLGFEEAEVEIDPVGGTFTARLLTPTVSLSGAPLTGFAGRWCADAGLLLAAVSVRHPQPGS